MTAASVEGYDNVRRVLRDPISFTTVGDVLDCGQQRPLLPLQAEPPEHRWYRSALDPIFASRAVAALESPVRAHAARLIDRFARDGSADFNALVARRFPVMVLIELLDLPPADLDLIRSLHDGILGPPGPPDATTFRRAVGTRVYDYLAPIVAERRRERGPDLIRSLHAADIEGRRVTSEEVIDICYLLLLAGIDPVSEALSCAVALLAERPDGRDALVADAGLLRRTLEESLRWGSSVKVLTRVATKDVEVEGTPVHAGERVGCVLTSANRDASVFDDPGVFNPYRLSHPHLTFGSGPHRCIGAHLARLELRVVLEELQKRIPDYRIDSSVASTIDPSRLGAGEELPLVFTPT